MACQVKWQMCFMETHIVCGERQRRFKAIALASHFKNSCQRPHASPQIPINTTASQLGILCMAVALFIVAALEQGGNP